MTKNKLFTLALAMATAFGTVLTVFAGGPN